MLQSSQRIIRHKVGLLNLAEELGNVWKACRSKVCEGRTPMKTLMDGKL